ncbi:MAG: PAS domain S-box protein [Cyanothece sp. SIO1E1]|nr:PAS domain S-box protein [Cyanothece sp. SIO1E1]
MTSNHRSDPQDRTHQFDSSQVPIEPKALEAALYCTNTEFDLASYRALYENTPSIYFTLNPVGVVCAVNQYGAEYLGYSVNELIGEPVFDTFHPDDQAALATQFFHWVQPESEASTTAVANWESRQLRKDGHTLWVRITARMLQGAPAHPIVLFNCEDISARKQVEARLSLMEQAILGSSNSIVITEATPNGHPIVFVNPAFEKTTGYTRTEVIGQDCRFLQGNDMNQPGLQPLRTALSQNTTCNVVLRNYRKDGSLFWNELHIAPIYDTNGQVTHFVGVQTDITARHRIETALRENQRFIQQIIDTTPNTLYIYDLVSQNITYLNCQIAEILGYPFQAIQANASIYMSNLIHPEDWVNFRQHYRRFARAQEGEVIEIEYRMKNAQGQWRWLQARETLFTRTSEGAAKEVLGTAQDITERRECADK